jgi:DnaJ-class molecular chaperone
MQASSKRGDMIVRVRIWTPAKLSGEEKKLLERLDEIQAKTPAPSRRLFEKTRESFR